jgi:4-amino-4-deoxy-L-arabinose transferase-like glycosyltransferase
VTPSRALPLALLLAVVVRVPFWIESLRTPVDGDTAIVGLMARHPGVGTTLWGQPYGSPVDSWVAWPFVAAWGTSTEALRLPCFLLGLALVPVAYGLARALSPGAALPAAVLVACAPPYMILLSALPPPLYATTLVLCGLVLLLAASAGRTFDEEGRPVGRLVLLGALGGLALWTHLMSASILAATGLWLLFRSRGRRRLLVLAVVPFFLASGPLWTRALGGGKAMEIVRLADRDSTVLAHLAEVVPRLYQPVGGLLGTHVPVVADAEDFMVGPPGWVAAALVLLYGLLLILAARDARWAHPSGLYLLAAALVVLAFPFPARAGPHTIRFLTPLYLPVAALVAWAASPRDPATRTAPRRAWVAILALSALQLVGATSLLGAWRTLDRAEPPFLLPDLGPVREVLAERGVRHAFASYGPAWRLTWESGERLVASQPWNERFRHWPLPYLDEVRFARNVAWVLTPEIPTDLPPPHDLDEVLRRLGGRWKRMEVGPSVVFLDFVPPYSPRVAPWPGAGAAGDGDPATGLTPDPEEPLELSLPEPTSLTGITLVAALTGPRLPRSMDVEVSADGTAFETVARRRRREEREDIRWRGGAPQAILDHDVIAIPLGGRPVAALRIVPWRSADPWTLGEVLIHAEEGRYAWDEWLSPDLDWQARWRALLETPLPEREDWYSRLLLVAAHRPVP